MARPRREEMRNESRDGEGRRARRLLGGSDFKMTVPERMRDPNYEYRWFNDSKNRLTNAEEADWEFVEGDAHIGTGAESNNNDGGSRISMAAGSAEDGKPVRAYLMRKKKEWHEEDQQEKQKRIDEVENQLRNRITPDGGLGQTESYGKVEIGRGR